MMRLPAVATAIIACLVLASSAGAVDLIPLLPADTLAAVGVDDVATLKKGWDKSPLGQALQDARLAELVEPFDKKHRDWKRRSRDYWKVSLDDLEQLVSGGAAGFVTLFEWPTPEVYEYDLCFLAEIRPEDRDRARDALETMLEKTPVDARRSRYFFKDEAVYVIQFMQKVGAPAPQVDPRTGRTTIETPEPGSAFALVEEIPIVIQYAIFDKYVIVCEGRREPARKIIAALKNPAERLGATALYRKASGGAALAGEGPAGGGAGRATDKAGTGAADPEEGRPEATVSGWLAAGRAWKIHADHIKQTNEKMDLSSLGLQDTGGLVARLRLAKEQIAFDAALEIPKASRGVFAMLVDPGAGNPLKTASLCPPNVSAFSSFLYDGQKLWSGIRSLVIQFYPQAWGLANMQITQFNQMFGIDMERGVIGTLGGELALYNRKRSSLAKRQTDGGDVSAMTFLLGLRDGKTFRQNHERMFQALTAEPYQLPIQKSTYLNYDIWNFRQDPSYRAPVVPAWTLTDGYLAVTADSEELPGFLRAWTGKADTSLAEDREFKKALTEFPQPGRLSFSYTAAETIPDVVQPLFYTIALTVLDDWELGRKAMEPEVRLALKRHIGSLAGGSYRESGLLRTHSRLSAAKP